MYWSLCSLGNAGVNDGISVGSGVPVEVGAIVAVRVGLGVKVKRGLGVLEGVFVGVSVTSAGVMAASSSVGDVQVLKMAWSESR